MPSSARSQAQPLQPADEGIRAPWVAASPRWDFAFPAGFRMNPRRPSHPQLQSPIPAGGPVSEQPGPPPVASLYVHVPFCLHKCEYCAFFSRVPEPELMDRYVRALIRELNRVAADLAPRTIYFGGGTPTVLNLRHWEQILQALNPLLAKEPVEFTVESNPATLSLEKASLLRAGGVNRMSLGIQSLNDALLNRLGRVHSRDMALRAFDWLRQAGFENLNLDLMFAIPGQTMDLWRETLTEALALGSEHLSCYEVTYEEDTPLYEQLRTGRVAVDEDMACDMYEVFVERSIQAGFVQYEVSNFARHDGVAPAEVPSYACRHNVNYWRGGSYYGLGPSAASYVCGVRSQNWADIPRYCENLERGQRPIESSEQLSPLARAGELAAFGLRMNAGWPLALFKAVTGFDLEQEWSMEIAALVKKGFGRLDADRFQLTTKGLRFADWVAEQFLRPSPG